MKELIRQLESIKQDLIQGKIRQQIDHRLSRTIEDKIDKAINYTHCCKSDSELLVCDDNELDCPFDFTSRCTIGRCNCKPKAN